MVLAAGKDNCDVRRTHARLGGSFGHPALVVLLVALVGLMLMAGCSGGRRGLGASQSWSGVAVQPGGESAFVGTRDGRIIEILLDRNVRSRTRPSLGAEFDANERRDESDGGRVAPAFYGTPTLARNRVYAASYQGFVYSLSAGADGAPLGDVGSFEIDGDNLTKGFTGSVVVADGAIVAAASESSQAGRLYVLSASQLDINARPSNVERCRYPNQGLEPVGPIWSTPVVVNGVAYFGDLNHFVHAVSLERCTLVWSAPAELGGAIVATPLVVGRTMYLGAFDRGFYAIDLSDGRVSKLFEANSWFWAGAASDGRYIYAPNLDGRLYAYDLDRLELAWTYDQEGGLERILSTPAIVGDNVVLASDSGILTLLDRQGQPLRRLGVAGDDVRAPLTLVDNMVFAHSLDEIITAYLVDNDDLDTEWELELPGF